MYNINLKIKYDGKIRLIIICSFFFAIEFAFLSAIVIYFKNYNIFFITLTVLGFAISTHQLYKLLSFKILNNVLDIYETISYKLLLREFKKSDISIAQLTLEVNEADKYVHFNRRLFSPSELKLVSIPKSTVHQVLDKLIEENNKDTNN